MPMAISQIVANMPSRRPHKHCCKVCSKKFLSGKALGGHMSCHRHAGKQPKGTPSPPAIVVDLPVLLLGPSDEKPSPSSLESQCLHCSKVFSSCQSPRGNMGMHSEKKVMAKPDEEPEPAGLMEAWANANGDHGHNVMLFSPVKRKRSKRGMPVLNSEMNAAAALLMLAEHSDKTSAYEDCCGGDKDDNISTPMVLKEVNLNAFQQLDQSDEFTNSARLKSDKNPAYEGFYEHCEKENSLNLVADAPKKEVLLDLFDYEMDVEAEFMKPGADISVEDLKSSLNLVADAPQKEVLLNVFDHGMDVDAEFMKPGADISVEELKSSDLSAAMNSKRHQCKGAAFSVELESSDISAAVNVKKHQCKIVEILILILSSLGQQILLDRKARILSHCLVAEQCSRPKGLVKAEGTSLIYPGCELWCWHKGNQISNKVHGKDAGAEEEEELVRVFRVEQRKRRDAPRQHDVQVALVGPDVGQGHVALGIPFPRRLDERPRAHHRRVGAAMDLHEPQHPAAHPHAAVSAAVCRKHRQLVAD
ncbi:unnamed protein product [Miscanthus lutarioriparius]|uniref:C2H2-type domain-containing protein n=1 Tax=Miscanthus lutarioriparius TaxID=422564 RepID=A0A811RAR1_9POAL|nr:unnamed protein product [Miscanthus lutarioriparius]